MSNTLKEIVRLIGFHKQMTVKEIAASIGYSRVHLQKELAKGDNPNLMRLLVDKYGEVIPGVSPSTNGTQKTPDTAPGLLDRLKDKDEIIRLLKEREQLQKSLDDLTRQIEVLAGLVRQALPAGKSGKVSEQVDEFREIGTYKSESTNRRAGRK